jgi:hypothetical protein
MEKLKINRKKIEIIGGALYFFLNFCNISNFFSTVAKKWADFAWDASLSEPRAEKIPGSFGS